MNGSMPQVRGCRKCARESLSFLMALLYGALFVVGQSSKKGKIMNTYTSYYPVKIQALCTL